MIIEILEAHFKNRTVRDTVQIDHRRPRSWPRRLPVVAVLLGASILVVSCGAKKKPGPKAVYEKWSAAVSRKDCRALYGLLDEKSRWAVMSAATDTAKAASAILKFYPDQRKRQALSKLGVSVADGDPSRYFANICRRYHYPTILAGTAGTIAELKVTGRKAVVVTEKGTKVELARDPYGRWGCTALRRHLVRRQLVASNFFKVVEQNAKAFGKKSPEKPREH